MASVISRPKVRISKIAGRYLVFDLDDVMHIRRHHGVCAVLVGTMPQNPTQNIFLSLPVELYAEEAALLQAKGVAYVADEAAEHLSLLRNMSGEMRRAYVQSIKAQRRNAQLAMDGEKAGKQARYQAQRRAKSKLPSPGMEPATAAAAGSSSAVSPEVGDDSNVEEESLFSPPTPLKTQRPRRRGLDEKKRPAVTPTTSAALLSLAPSPDYDGYGDGKSDDGASRNVAAEHASLSSSRRALNAHLNELGYFITPGLRFGGDYSVYPGDPFRFHAHFLATSYGWDEELSLLDLVSSGRLGTSVKKSFLMAGLRPAASPLAAADDEGRGKGGGELRAFCIEWAGM